MLTDWTRWPDQLINGKFVLGEQLAASDNGAVFSTYLDSSHSKAAAIKFLAVANDSAAESQLLLWERVQRLSHPHLLRIVDTGRHIPDGQLYVYAVMEYAGEDLSMILPSRALTPEEARQMLVPLLEALAYLHQEGWVHGRIQPSNVMVVEETVKISSDGIRQDLPAVCEATGYSAPESAQGKMTPASDIWAMGITLVEALTQQKPRFPSAGKPALLSTAVPPPFREIAEGCLQNNPEQRPTARQILARLNRSPSGAAPAPPHASLPAETGSRADAPRRRGIPAWMLAPLAILLIATAFWYLHSSRSKSGASAAGQPTHSMEEVHQPTATSGEPPRKADSPAKVIRQILPDISASARRTIRGTIRIKMKVSVGPSGEVENVRMESTGPSRYFASKASDAVRQWKFDPPISNGRPQSAEWSIEFQLRSSGTRVRAEPIRT